MLIKWWQGTDAYTLYKYPPSDRLQWYIKIFLRRLFWKLFHSYFTHWINHPEMGYILDNVGISNYTLRENPDYDHTKYNKIPHNSFNILYYHPKKRNQKWIKWIYGIETIFSIMAEQSKNNSVNWIRLDGTIDMEDVLSIADCYIKVNTHIGSGKNRIAKECFINNIPVIYTDYNKSIKDNIEHIVRNINELRKNASTA